MRAMEIDLPDRKWWALCDANGCRPVPLDRESGKLKSFVYDRAVGVIPCSFGAHPGIMSLLLAWRFGCNGGVEVAEKLGLEFSRGTADRFLTLEGAAFRSSQGAVVEAWSPRNLEDWEIAFLGEIRYIGG